MTKIEWTQKTWNPVTGCTKVSQGCKHCYAERMANRLAGRYGYPEKPNQFKVTLHPEKFEEPLKWGKPRRVFVNSMSDLFHEDVPFDFILHCWMVMAGTKHIYQVLTKRPERMHRFVNEWLPGAWGLATMSMELLDYPIPNIWLGVSVEDQKTADERIPWLLKTPAAVRFVSYEPALGPVIFAEDTPEGLYSYLSGNIETGMGTIEKPENAPKIDWIIAGGESGTGARPAHPDWFRSVRNQCVSAGVPFFFKQWGGWIPKDHYLPIKTEYGKIPGSGWGALKFSGEYLPQTTTWNGRQGDPEDDYEVTVYRIGKKRAGRLLDGREWNEYPLDVKDE